MNNLMDSDHKETSLEKVNFDSVTAGSVPSGAIYQPLHGGRKVKTYLIQKHELKMLGNFNRSATIWYAIMSGCITAVVACVWDLIPAESANWAFSFPRVFFIILLILGGLASRHVGRGYSKDRDDMISSIEDESKFDDTETSY
ncbi:MAG: hypothetical protein P1U89_02550 [Verrucomicrobiales bacterium]|nr:hypothetical protein [Verrucomicrobiales bacterium]